MIGRMNHSEEERYMSIIKQLQFGKYTRTTYNTLALGPYQDLFPKSQFVVYATEVDSVTKCKLCVLRFLFCIVSLKQFLSQNYLIKSVDVYRLESSVC